MTPRPVVLVVELSILLLCASEVSAVKRRSFVTSVEGTGDLFSWAGSSGATALERGDSICRARATAAGLPNAATYRAWLSTSTTDAYCHVQGLTGLRSTGCGGAPLPGGGPWYQVNGVTQFTADLETLTGSERVVYRQVLFDEFANAITDSFAGAYWTGSNPTGSASSAHCANWTSNASASSGCSGTSVAGSYSWSYWFWRGCSSQQRLLCLEPGESEATAVAWQPGSLTFATSEKGSGELSSWPHAGSATGLAAGDAICRNLAGEAHLPDPDSFTAWLSDAVTDAVDRLTGNGPYRRLDGFVVANNKAGLASGGTLNSIHVDELFTYLGDNGYTRTGTGADGLGTGEHCLTWSSADPSDQAAAGYATISRDAAWTNFGYGQECASPARIYCFSNRVTLFWDGFDSTGDTGRWSSTVP